MLGVTRIGLEAVRCVKDGRFAVVAVVAANSSVISGSRVGKSEYLSHAAARAVSRNESQRTEDRKRKTGNGKQKTGGEAESGNQKHKAANGHLSK